MASEPNKNELFAVPGIDGVAGLVARLRDHKIAQWTLAYVGAAIRQMHAAALK